MSITETNAAQSAYFAEHPHDIAEPDWDSLTSVERDEHRQTCETGCSMCDGHRAWGECVTCGLDAESWGPFELSRCCGSIVALTTPTEDNLAALRAA